MNIRMYVCTHGSFEGVILLYSHSKLMCTHAHTTHNLDTPAFHFPDTYTTSRHHSTLLRDTTGPHTPAHLLHTRHGCVMLGGGGGVGKRWGRIEWEGGQGWATAGCKVHLLNQPLSQTKVTLNKTNTKLHCSMQNKTEAA